MKLPHQTQPAMRVPAAFSAGPLQEGGIGPARVQPQKTDGRCECFIDVDDYWRPGRNGCWAGVPQCDGRGDCTCVDRAKQFNNGAAKDITGFRRLD